MNTKEIQNKIHERLGEVDPSSGLQKGHTMEQTASAKIKDEIAYDLVQGYNYYQKEIAKKYGITDRQVRRIIRDLRFEGYPIISGNEGYRMALDEEEIKVMVYRLASQIKAHGDLIQAIKYIKV